MISITKKIYRYFRLIAQRCLPGYSLVERYKLYVKYVISGGTSAVTDLGLLFIFTELFNIWYLLSAILAFLIAFFVSFYLQKFWTFRDTDIQQIKKQAGLYLAVALVNLGVNTGGMFLLVEKLDLWYIFAQIIMGALIAFSSFIIYNFFIFSGGSISGENKDKKEGLKKNILICTGIYPPDIGGPATYVKILQEKLPEYDHNFKIKIITYGKSKNSDEVYYISRQQNKLFRYLKYAWQAWKLIPWSDIVYAQGPVSEGYPTYWACKLRGRKYFLKIVGDYAWEQYQLKIKNDELRIKNFITPDDFQNKKFDSSTERKRKIEHKVAQNAEKIIVPSEYLKKIVRQWRVDRDKINVIYNTIEFKNFEPIKKPENEKWIVSVGRLTPWKGMNILIEAISEISEDNLKLIIIGDGPEFNNLKSKIKNLRLEDRVKLLGKLSHNETMSYAKTANIFVLNTGYEGLPHTVLEAMNLETPVITTNIGGNPEVIENNKTGILVEYNNKEQFKDAILRLLSDKNLTDELTNNARASLNKFDKQKMISDTINILTS